MAPTTSDTALVYIGTYTGGTGSQGIYIYRLDCATGALEYLSAVSGLVNPTFLAVDPKHRYLYAVQEVSEHTNQPGGAISAFSINPANGELTLINHQSTRGAGPCYVSVDHSGRWALVANYVGGSVCVLPILENGALGEATAFVQHHGSDADPAHPIVPHAHTFVPDPANHFMLANDLGLDKIFVYQLDMERGTLSEGGRPGATLQAGAGPRHLAFHPNNTWLYCINELDSTITAFTYDSAQGALQALQTVPTLPDGFTGKNSCAHILVEPSGRYLYGSNRGHNSIAIFAIDATSGHLQPVGHLTTDIHKPRNFNIDPTGNFLIVANQDSGTLIPFRIDHATGALSAAGDATAVPAPVCVCIVA